MPSTRVLKTLANVPAGCTCALHVGVHFLSIVVSDAVQDPIDAMSENDFDGPEDTPAVDLGF